MARVLNRVGGGSGGDYPSVFFYGDGLTSSGSVTMTGQGKTYNGVWGTHQKPNPEYRNLPSGYTQLASIKSDGTSYIMLTGYKPNISTFEFDVKFKPNTNTDWETIFGARTGDKNKEINVAYNSAHATTENHYGMIVLNSSRYAPLWDDNFVGSSVTLSLKGTTLTKADGTTTTVTKDNVTLTYDMCILALNTFTIYQSAQHVDLEMLKFYNNGTMVYDLVPCKNSSNQYGMYDLVNNTFYGNSGSGSFVVGAEVPQYISTQGFLVDKIKSFGTYSYTVTQDGRTKTDSILIDAVEDYTIQVVFSRLPSDYTEVNYIQSSGTQYIDTGISGADGFRVVTDVKIITQPTSWSEFIGCENSGGSGRNYVGHYDGSGGFKWSLGSCYRYYSSVTPTLGSWYHIDAATFFNNVYYKVDEVILSLTSTQQSGTSLCDRNIYMFALNSAGSVGLYSKIALKETKIYSLNGTLVRDFVPCYNSSNVVGLYDLVTNTFYTNSGTGVFVYG